MKLIFLVLLFTASNVLAQITQNELEQVFQATQKTYGEELRKQNIELVFNFQYPGLVDFWWKQDSPQASFVEMPEVNLKRQFYIYFFGGLARFSQMTKEGAALFVCHELGHAIADGPRKNSGPIVEGESDYFATSECIHELLPHLSEKPFQLKADEKSICQNAQNQQKCERILNGILSYKKVLESSPIQNLSLFKKAPEVARSIDTDDRFYPTPQCRLDTLLAGLQEKARPVCWFPAP